MRNGETRTVRDVSRARTAAAQPLKQLPQRTTKHMHQRLLRALNDRRIKRAFS
jgi:hypothetical protein